MSLIRSRCCAATMSLWLAFSGCAVTRSSVPEPSQVLLEELATENAALRRRVETLEEQLAVALRGEAQVISCDAYPPIDAIVLEVNDETRQVVLDKGQDAKVKVGYLFHIFLGSTFKGLLRVEKVERWTCSGVILGQFHPISSGDCATTNL